MDKRIEEQLRVKNAMANAYVSLLKHKTAENISVTDITNHAHVSRMAFYRNFQTKMEVMEFYLKETLLNEMLKNLNEEPNIFSVQYGVTFLRHCRKFRDIFLLLDDQGYSSLVMKAFNNVNEDINGDMPSNSIARYKLYMAAGASYNSMLVWLRGGCRETPEELAAYMEKFYTALNDSWNIQRQVVSEIVKGFFHILGDKMPDLSSKYKDYISGPDVGNVESFIREICDYANLYHDTFISFDDVTGFSFNDTKLRLL